MNLIEQQNILRGLADNALQQEMNSGTVPPYLVLAEINRRKTARERYEAAVAKRGGGRTVAEDLLGKSAPKGIDAIVNNLAQPQPAQAGIEAAMPQEPQGYAKGGLVDALPAYAPGGPIDLNTLVSQYQARLSGLDEDRKMAQKMALMNIGAQIMAGRSRNTLSNVGAGLSAALPGYQQSMTQLNHEELQNMRDQIDLARQMQQDQLAQQDRQWTRDRAAKADELALIPSWAQDEAALSELEKTDPQKAALYRKLKADMDASSGAAARKQAADKIIADVAGQYDPISDFNKDGFKRNATEVAQARMSQEQDRINNTYSRLLAAGLTDEAKQFMETMQPVLARLGGNVGAASSIGQNPDDFLGVLGGGQAYGVDTTQITPPIM